MLKAHGAGMDSGFSPRLADWIGDNSGLNAALLAYLASQTQTGNAS